MKTIPLPTDTEAGREIVKALLSARSPFVQYRNKNEYWKCVEEGDCLSLSYYSFRLLIPESPYSDTCGMVDGLYETIPKDAAQPDTKTPNDLCQGSTCKQDLQVQCTCGFDAEGWREMNGSDRISADDECKNWGMEKWWPCPPIHIGFEPPQWQLNFRTRRHKADCPTLKAPVEEKPADEPQVCAHQFVTTDHGQRCLLCGDGWFGSEPSEKPMLDLSGEISCIGKFIANANLTEKSPSWAVYQALSKIQDHINQTK